MIQLLVFDWDGTLADSVSKLVACKQEIARRHHLAEPSTELIKSVLGMKFSDAMKLCFPAVSASKLEVLGCEFNLLMGSDACRADLFPGTKAMLARLREAGYQLAIASSKHERELISEVDECGLGGWFDLVCGGGEKLNKPSAVLMQHITAYCNATPMETVMIGDTLSDIEFANNAGTQSIAVTYGAHSENKLRLLNPGAIVHRIEELPATIETL